MNELDEQRISAEMIARWLRDSEGVDLTQEQTRLENGGTISHHREDQCSGNCCLHGTSIYEQCKQPRLWNTAGRYIEHICPCGVRHACGCYIDYTGSRGVHACCDVLAHCPQQALGTRDGDVNPWAPWEPEEPIDPLKSLRLAVSAHDYLLSIHAKNQRDSAKAQERLAAKVLNQAKRLQSLERSFRIIAALYGVLFLVCAYGFSLLSDR